MAQLVFIDGPYMGSTVPLAPVNSIGRAGSNEIQLDENGISETHATLKVRAGKFHIARADPKARIVVNGREVNESVLNHGDILMLGPITLLFSDEGTPRPAPPPSQDFDEKSPITSVESRVKQFADPAEVVAAFKKNNRLSHDLETLYRVSAAISATLNLDDLLKALNALLFEVFKPDRVFILLTDELGTLRVASKRMSERSSLTGFVNVSWTIINEAIEHREGILTLDASADERFKLGESIVDQSIQSALCVPIAKHEKIMGAIHMDSLTQVHPFTREDLNLLSALSSQVALAIENVLNYDRSVEYSRRLIQLGENSRKISSFLSRDMICREAVESAARIFESERVSLLITDARGDLTMAHSLHIPRTEWDSVRLRKSDRWAGRVLADGRPILIADASTESMTPIRAYETKSFLIVPVVARAEGLRRDSKTIGVLTITDKKSRRIFDANDQEFMTIFASQVGIALQNATLFEKSTVDTLTKLFTRQFFFARLDEEFAAAKSQKAPMTVAMFDLDNFKMKNDQFGHAAGDLVLSTVAGIAKAKILTTGGMIARFGGEEFLAMIPGMPLQRAQSICEDIRMIVEKHAITFEGKSIPSTISIGLAELRMEDTPESLVKRADVALYAAKRAGRNRVELEASDSTVIKTIPPPATF